MANTPIYGFETPDDTDLVKDGALSIRTALDDVDTTLGTALNSKDYAGLSLIKTQAIGSGVTSITVTDVFSATYDNYRVVINGLSGSLGTAFLQLRMAAVSSHFGSLSYDLFNGTNTAVTRTNAGNQFQICPVGTPATSMGLSFDIQNPFNSSAFTTAQGLSYGGGFSAYFAGAYQVNTSFTNVTFLTSSGTLTGGTINIYGYGKS
jgi:hypothetical protein